MMRLADYDTEILIEKRNMLLAKINRLKSDQNQSDERTSHIASLEYRLKQYQQQLQQMKKGA